MRGYTLRGNIFKGGNFLISGLKLIFSKGLKRFILVPICINSILFVFIIGFAAINLWNYFYSVAEGFPVWAIYSVGMLIFFIYSILSVLITATLFVFVTNFVAAPFYGLLAEKTEKLLTGKNNSASFGFKEVFLIIPRTIGREITKLLSFLPWIALGGFAFIFPLLMPLAPIIWFIIMAWILAIQYTDYTPDNHGKNFAKTKILLKKEPITIIGFGIVTSFLITIPILNLLVPPAAVVGGCKLWLYLQQKYSPL